MTELATKAPSEVAQLKNFVQGGREIIHHTGKKPSAQKVLLVGLMTIIPDAVRNSGILQDTTRTEAVAALLSYQIRMNDRIDFEGSGRKTLEAQSQTARNEEDRAAERYRTALKALPEEERLRVSEAVANSVKEVEFVENWIRERRDARAMNFSDVDLYRGLVNAISTAIDVSVILGPSTLDEKLKPIPTEQLDIQDIVDKYAWISGNSPSNSVEQAVMIAYNTTMDGQVSDDWNDRQIDYLMNVPSYGVAAMKMCAGDERAAKTFLKHKRLEYREKAKELGLGKIPAKGISTLVSVMEKGKKRYIERARRRGTSARRAGLREREYVKGNLDY